MLYDRDRVVGTVTKQRQDGSGLESRQRQGFFASSKCPARLWSQKWPYTRWVQAAYFPGLKLLESDVDHSVVSDAEAKNKGCYNCTRGMDRGIFIILHLAF